MRIDWTGVMPAITTAFNSDLTVDHGFVAEHVRWLVGHGCTGIVPGGSLGEGAALSFDEKLALMKTVVDAVGDRVPVIPGIAALTTAEAIRLARGAQDVGCAGLMVLPPYLYPGDWREMRAHMSAVIGATDLPCIVYNNPIAYKTDFTPEQIVELARSHENVEAVKESSTDARRISGIRAVMDRPVALGVGVDDCLVEGVAIGARFWIAGLVNAFPQESVRLHELAVAGRIDEAQALYRWFLPLLRMDTVVKFVQLIKLVQMEVGMGHERVRPPRLELSGDEREQALAVVRRALDERPVA